MGYRLLVLIIFCLIGLYAMSAYCSAGGAEIQGPTESTPPELSSQVLESELDLDSPEGESQKIGIAPIPIIFYTPETSLAIGGGIVFTFRDPQRPNDKRPDNLQLIAAYTLKNQIFLSLVPEIYFNEKKGKLRIQNNYSNWPTSFFGIGNDADVDIDEIDDLEEVYTNESFTIQPWVTHKAVSHLSLGITLDVKHADISDTEADGIIEQGQLTGADGGTRAGMGPVLEWDTRDAIFYPTQGNWHQLWSWHYRDMLGSDFTYDVYAIDLRTYLSLADDHILAFHALGVTTDGEVPFDELPSPDIRGLYDGLFVDRHMVTLEAEYRFPIHERWSGVVFSAMGDVFHDSDELKVQNIKYAAGGGLRFAINKEERINLRFDIGVSPYGIFPYVLFQESF